MSVFITGIGCVSGIGLDANEHLQAFRNKQDGLGKITLFRSRLQFPVAEVKRANSELKSILGLSHRETFSRTALLAMCAAKQAFDDAHLYAKDVRIGLISASSTGGMDLTENVYPALTKSQNVRLRNVAHHDIGDHTEQVAAYLNISGFRTTISTACSSAANAILLGARMIEQDVLDVVIAGGADALCKFTWNGFNSLLILDQNPCCPYDENRNGLNLGEGAGYVVLQSEKLSRISPKIYGKLIGYANANDAFHQTASSPHGEGAFLAMSRALEKAGITPSDVDYINAHGTGTKNNDLSESVAIKRLFADNIPMFSSTKAFTGHTLGAAGGLETVFSLMSIHHNVIFPNLRFCAPITETNLTPVSDFKENCTLHTVLSNSFGFGGNNTSLIFQKHAIHE